MMRRLSSGTITYTYTDLASARSELPGGPVWVAPNSLYRASDIRAANSSLSDATTVLYVGRLEPAKKVGLLIRGFVQFQRTHPDARLEIVGAGSEAEALKALVLRLDAHDSVSFAGPISGVDELRPFYARAFCAGSPGFAGLGVTQAIGFGVPMVIADDEPHSPEIELAVEPDVYWFEAGRPGALASALDRAWNDRSQSDPEARSLRVRARYSAEAMAGGLESALRGSGGDA